MATFLRIIDLYEEIHRSPVHFPPKRVIVMQFGIFYVIILNIRLNRQSESESVNCYKMLYAIKSGKCFQKPKDGVSITRMVL